MTKPDKPVPTSRVPCEVCLKEIPRSEAQVSEARDYVAYFCGLECYELWNKQAQRPDGGGEGSGSAAAGSGDRRK